MTDKRSVQLVIAFLGLVALSIVIGGLVLANRDKSIPPELIAMGSLAVGAVAGILAKTSSEPMPPPQVTMVPVNGGPMPVTVENLPSEPVPVEATPPTKPTKKTAPPK